jgi:chromosomal replication initiation ATPase DnaA
MNLTQKLELFRQQADALAKTIEDISSFVIVSRSKRIDIIQRCVCEMVGVPIVCMQSGSRIARYVEARWIAYTITRELTAKSYEKIGSNFRAGTDHGTIINGINELRLRISVDPKLGATVAEIKAECKKRIDAHAMPLFTKAKKTKTQ